MLMNVQPHGSDNVVRVEDAFRSRCQALASSALAAGRLPAPAELDDFARASAILAREGIALRSLLHAVHTAASQVLRQKASGGDSSVVDGAVLMVSVLEVMGSAVSSVYLDSCSPSAGDRDRLRQLTESMLDGSDGSLRLAARAGVAVASHYDVITLTFVDDGTIAPSVPPAVQSTIDRIQDDAVRAGGTGTLVSLNGSGGVVLLPEGASGTVETLVGRIEAVLGRGVHAATAPADVDDVPSAAAHCRELTALARGMKLRPGVYRTADLALEFQLTRPGPGRGRLRSLIAPLGGTPELVHTLRTFISTEANRRASAKALFVHPNTVDYRLKRIETLTGVDPLSPVGLMALHAALVVDALVRAEVIDVVPRSGDVAEAS